jgi:hypothetical protein
MQWPIRSPDGVRFRRAPFFKVAPAGSRPTPAGAGLRYLRLRMTANMSVIARMNSME